MVHFFLYLLGSSLVVSQFLSLTSLDSGVSASFRGLSVVNNSVVWVSGTGGTVLRTIDNGENWKNVSVPEMENTDFRDIHGFNKNIAIVMGIDSPARFFKTIDGGKSWDLVHFDDREEVFFDGMSFWNKRNGIAFSDPVNGRHLLIRTTDGGDTWEEIPADGIPEKLDPVKLALVKFAPKKLNSDTSIHAIFASSKSQYSKLGLYCCQLFALQS